MKDRLNKFLELEHISAAKFADDIGVQRSSISHILSGRNNPSYDFIQKILNKYKKLNAEWLIMGTGNIYKTVVQGNLFNDTPIQQDLKIDVGDNYNEQIIPTDGGIKANISDETTTDSQLSDKSIEKKVEKILILYNDRSFSTYNPE
jgi:transcriptional regulator with XRE-family HTH domain